MFKDKRYRDISGILLILGGLIFLLSLASYDPRDYRALVLNRDVSNLLGPVGSLIAHLFRSAFGISSYIFVLMLFTSSWSQLKSGSVYPVSDRLFALFFISISLSSFMAIGTTDLYQYGGGFLGHYIYGFLKSVAGLVGSYLIIVILNLIGLILLGIVSLTYLFEMEKVNSVSSTLRKFFDWISVNKYDQQIPLNYIDRELRSGKKLPWIVKKKVLTGTNKEPKNFGESIKFLEMNVPAARDEILAAESKVVEPPEYNEPGFEDFEDPIEFYKEEFDQINDSSCDDIENSDFSDPDVSDLDEEAEDALETFQLNNYAVEPEVKQQDVEDPESFMKKNRIFGIDCETDDETPEEEEVILPQTSPEVAADKFTDSMESPCIEEAEIFKEIKINQEYIIPTEFLHSSKPLDSETWESEIKKNSQLLVRTLSEFGIESRVIAVNRGPVITLYELQIAAGIKINRVVGLSDDIAMALAAYRVRIVAPIPGKSAIGVEIPNKQREMVTLGDIVKSPAYQAKKGSLKVALGKDILGNPVTLDLKKQPHLLIAGATGSGKSVCVNTFISSIVYNYDPNYVKFIMVDPKMVELQPYNGMPHLLSPVITEPHMAPAVLKWSIYEMERRYRLLAGKNSRDIVGYNDKIKKERKGGENLPFIVIIIDELADLMMVASKEIEGYITRLAQKARAVGIHLVLATQRPSVDVITGIIKANFPARIAFQVAQKTDSRTIIDQNGAEKLLGKGDMLYQSPTSSYPVRIQGAFISEEEVEEMVDHLHVYGHPHYIDIEQCLKANEVASDADDEDELFVDALKIVEDTRKASASYLQRRLSIGYNRAARIIERMEDMGYVGPQQGSKPREVYV